MPKRLAALLLLAVAVVFWPVLGGAFVYDDVQLVVRNVALQHDDLATLLTRPMFGTEHGYWRPLTSLVLWLGNRVGGAHGIHALALLLHGAATLVAFALGQRLFGRTQTAFWLALLFAVHPVQVESVGWCSAINDPMWGLFALLAVQSAMRWREAGSRGAPWLSALWCLLSLLSKENGIAAMPLVVATLAWRRTDDTRPPRLANAMFALAAALLLWWSLRTLVFGEIAAGLLRAPAGAGHDLVRVVSAPAELLTRHLGLLAWPFALTPFRSLPHAQPLTTSACALLVLGAVLVVWFLRHRLSATSRIGISFLIVPLLPTLLRWQTLGSYPIADRYLYLPALGFAMLLVPWLCSPRARLLPYVLAVVWAGISFAQTWIWHDADHLIAKAMHHAPNDPTLLVMAGDLALMRAQHGDAAAFAAARRAYSTAESLAAADHPELLHRALAPARLGLAWCLLVEQQGRRSNLTQALIAAFQRAVDTDPSSAPAWVGLGVANGIAERRAEAERSFRKALELDPNNAEADANLTRLHSR